MTHNTSVHIQFIIPHLRDLTAYAHMHLPSSTGARVTTQATRIACILSVLIRDGAIMVAWSLPRLKSMLLTSYKSF